MRDWEAMYQKQETGWDRGQASPALAQWLAVDGLLSPQLHRILIPGCGRGHEVVALAQLGFDVTGIDLAPSAIQALKTSLNAAGVSASVVQANIFDYQPADKFDVIYEQTCLCAIEPDQRRAYVRQMQDWLKPGGMLLFSMMQTGAQGGPPYDCALMDMRDLFSDKCWHWAEYPPFVIPRGHQSARFELGFVLKRK